MSVLLFVVGALSVLAGAAMIAFGMPVKEFSFGNTMILAGVIAIVGGLIVIALGIAVAQLHRIAEMLGARPLSRSGRPFDALGQSGSPAARTPFPPKPKSEKRSDVAFAPPPFEETENHTRDHASPSLPNPDVSVVPESEAEDAPLSPRQPPVGAPAAGKSEMAERMRTSAPISGDGMVAPKSEPAWRPAPASERREQPSYFDAMWPSEQRKTAEEPQPSRAESIPRRPSTPAPELKSPPASEAKPRASGGPPRNVAVLKSGVVDGMGYTLYVDGSIEAELPDGTLRFASINELRQHLETNS